VLVSADVVAAYVYRRDVVWHYLWKLLPPTVVGVLIGWALFDWIPATVFSGVIGVLLLVMTALHFLRQWLMRNQAGASDPVPHTRWFINATGLAGGLATMLANAAGPVAAFYLMAVKLPKYAFIGTTAWFFFSINLFKMPFQVLSGYISPETLQISLPLGLVAATGAGLAPKVVRYIPQKWFSMAIWTLIVFAGIRLIV